MVLFCKVYYTGKPVLETTCIKRSPALRDHCSDTTHLLNIIEPVFNPLPDDKF